jgi:hypothetical protein
VVGAVELRAVVGARHPTLGGRLARRCVPRRPIDQVWRYPKVLSRDRYLSLHGQDWETDANRWFDNLAGGRDYIDPEIPANDLTELRERTRKVRDWVNTSVAHASARVKRVPALTDIHENLRDVLDLFLKYMALIRGVGVSRDVTMSPWEVVFTVPWIPDDAQRMRIAMAIHKGPSV